MAEKYAAFGTILKHGDGADPEVFTGIAGIRSIGGPALTIDTVDVTAHDSAGGFEEIVPTIKRTGDMPLEVVFDPADATHIALKADFDARTRSNYEMVFPDAAPTTYEFAAYVTGFELDAPHDGALIASVTLKITGAVTEAA